MRTGNDDHQDDDDIVRAALARAAPRTGPAHDQAILEAAARVADERRARRRRRWSVPLSLAASLCLLGMWGLWLLRVEPPDTLRGGDPALAGAVSPQDAARLSTTPDQLRWSAVPGASQYVITLRDATGAILGTADSAEATSLPLSRVAMVPLPPGTYFWVVNARGPALERELGPFSFQVGSVP